MNTMNTTVCEKNDKDICNKINGNIVSNVRRCPEMTVETRMSSAAGERLQ